MATPTHSQKTVLVIGANGYIGNAVARAFQRAGFATYGLVRSSLAAEALEDQSIVPIVGSAADAEAAASSISAHTTTLNVIASTTEDTNDYASHFNKTMVLLRILAEKSNNHGVRPLVLFTSGCKDYGRGGVDSSPNLQPHTEESPIRPPLILAARANHAVKVLKEDLFDATVLRPTNVHGYSSSYYGKFFELAADAKRNGEAVEFRADPHAILHSLHVDDCGDAYVALTDQRIRDKVSGQYFNISPGKRYETLRDVGEALNRLYGIKQKCRFDPPDPEFLETSDPLTNFSQWVGSEKIRNLTGWADRRPLFAEGISQYKQEYEFAVQGRDENVARAQGRDWNEIAKTLARTTGTQVQD